MKGKKAQQLNVTTIIILILAILVLVIVAVSYAGGWAKLWSRIASMFQQTAPEERTAFIEMCKNRLIFGDKIGFCEDAHNVAGLGNVTCEKAGEVLGWDIYEDQSDKARTFCK